MAQSRIAFWPATDGLLAGTGRLAARNIRLTVVVAVALICGSFAAAATLQMRFDRVHAFEQANFFETRRAHDIAAVIAASLERYRELGAQFADGHAPAGVPVRNVAVFAADGSIVSTLRGNDAFVRLPPGLIHSARHRRVVVAEDGFATIAFAHMGHVVAVSFDERSLAPDSLMERAMLTTARATAGTSAAVEGWPVAVVTSLDEESALSAWYGSLPLYLFVILGPALAGAGLAAVFVREFERRARATEAIRALRTTRPGDARLLVRLADAERQAVEARRSKAEFIAHMSHELRTPLNAIIGFSEVIERGFYGAVGHAKYVEYAHDIGTAGRGLHDKIGDILEFANVEAGRYPLAPVVCDVHALAAQCVDEHGGRAFSRRIALDIVPAAPTHALADPLAVRRILSSLLDNALSYTAEGGKVRVDIRVEEAAVIASVEDDGTGFKPHEAASAGHAFRRFDRPGADTGAGLGLAIAMSLAHRMGGAVRLASAPGAGTRAELRLPKI